MNLEHNSKKVVLLHLQLKGEPKTIFTKLAVDEKNIFRHTKAALVERLPHNEIRHII